MRPRKIFVVGCIFIFVGIVFGLISLGIYIYDREFKKTAIETTAKVIDIEQKKTIKTTISYEANNEVVKKELNIFNSSYYVGEEIQIFYQKDDTSKIIDETHPLFIRVFGILGGSIFTFGTFICFYAIDKRAKRLKSLKEQQ